MRFLLTFAVIISLPALLVLLGVVFQNERSRQLLVAYGRPLVYAGMLVWGGCLAARLYSGEPAWGVVASILGLVLVTGVAIARSRVT